MNSGDLEAGNEAMRAAVLTLLSHLADRNYHFVTPNRGVHALVSRRRAAEDDTLLRDIFGWVRPFSAGMLPSDLENVLRKACLISANGDHFLSRLRVSTVGGLLFAHSAPRAGKSAVFLGPDSYRYARFLRQTTADSLPAETALDIGIGAGVGALTLLSEGLAQNVYGSDVNPLALTLAALNAEHAGLPLQTRLAEGVPEQPQGYDLIIANPPFIAGQSLPTYSDGGDLHGAALSLEWARTSLKRLRPGGRFVLYTGAPVVNGIDLMHSALGEMAEKTGYRLAYDEIDPDIFGGNLKRPDYQDVERIAAIGAVLVR